MATLTDTHKAALKQFRERQRHSREESGQAAARFRQERKAVASALKGGPSTVPQLAQATGLPPHQVLWHLAGMRKYGIAQETAQDGDYPRYELVVAAAHAPSAQN